MLLNELPLVPPWLHDITQETRNLGQGPNPSLSIWSNCTTLLQSKIAGWKLPFWKWWCLCEAFSVHQPGFFELHAKGLNLIGVIVADIKCNLTKYLPNVSLRNPEPSCPSSCSLTCTQNGTSFFCQGIQRVCPQWDAVAPHWWLHCIHLSAASRVDGATFVCPLLPIPTY